MIIRIRPKVLWPVLLLLVLGFAALIACVPASSVHPLYTGAELLEPIAEPAIEGEWVSFSPLRPEEANKPKVFFKITLMPAKRCSSWWNSGRRTRSRGLPPKWSSSA